MSTFLQYAPTTLQGLRDMVLCLLIAGASLWIEPSVLMGFAWLWALISTWFLRVEKQAHRRTHRAYRDLVQRVRQYQKRTQRDEFPESMLN